MALSDYVPLRAWVEFEGGSFQVRGLALDDVALLVRNHLPDLDNVIMLMRSQADSVAIASMVDHAVRLMKEAPGLCANLIAIASDEPDAVETARILPMPVQLRALELIGDLTFKEAGGPKNFLASLKNLLTAAMPALMTQPGSST